MYLYSSFPKTIKDWICLSVSQVRSPGYNNTEPPSKKLSTVDHGLPKPILTKEKLYPLT